MAPAEWDQIFEIFHAAREGPAGERLVLLDAACGENTVFRKAVEELLKHDETTTGFLGKPLLASLVAEPRTTRIRAGQLFGRYVTVELIGRGGIGEVWSARDTDLDRPVALKFLSNEELVGLDAHQITHEAKTASALNHPGIVTIYEVVHSESTFAIAMELVEGESLRELCGKPMRAPELAAISRQIAEALAAAHAGGIVHGDIKPQNILLRRDRYVKLLDFGLARRVTAETIASGLPALGTLRYMSPEQPRGEPLTPASDIFSFGLVLYELATGRNAFPSISPLDAVQAMLTKEPSPPASVNAAIPAHLDSIVRAMLAKEPAARPSAEEVARALEEPQTPRNTIRFWSWALTIAGLVAACFAVWWWRQAPEEGNGPSFR
jgi:serine/threonine protein kinase